MGAAHSHNALLKGLQNLKKRNRKELRRPVVGVAVWEKSQDRMPPCPLSFRPLLLSTPPLDGLLIQKALFENYYATFSGL